MEYVTSHPGYEELAVDDVRLITPDESHAEASLSWVQTIDVVQYMGADFPSPTLDGERQRIHDIVANTDEYSWMIEHDGNVIGNVCINSIRETTEKLGMRAGNLTILIGEKDSWGKGIALKSCSAVLTWAKNAGFVAMAARALQENIGSIKMLKKMGFIETGMEPYDGLVHGKPSMWRNFSKML